MDSCKPATAISTVHPDIISTHILTRLDGPTLASLSLTSTHLHAISSDDDNLWRHICTATWPSINHPRIRHVISTFPAGHRSFFSDSFPFLQRQPSIQTQTSSLSSEEPAGTSLISVVDLFYGDNRVYSKVMETETVTGWFLSSPFRLELLDSKDPVSTLIPYGDPDDATWLKHLEENLKLSWILIDPILKRAANLSSRKPVSVRRQWLTGDVEIRFATVVGDGKRSADLVEVPVVVTCTGKEGGVVDMTEVSLQANDVEGKCLNGKDSLVILKEAMKGQRRRDRGEFGNFEAFLQRKREWMKSKQSQDRAMDLACVSFWVLLVFVYFIFYR